tara:strand:+ start:488 stop:778 length:291 start_codon:yes stop_codon:yes gene_type:complete
LANAPPSFPSKKESENEQSHRKVITMETTKIKLQRLQLGLTLAKMAERLGVKQRTYQRYEKGEREMPKPVAMLHEALKRNAILERNEQLAKERGKK